MNGHPLKKTLQKYQSLLCVLGLVFLSLPGTAVHAEQVFRLGTGGNAGSYFPIGSLVATAVNKQRIKSTDNSELVILPQRSSGSVSNLKDIAAGLLEGGLVQADVASLAYRDAGQFKGSGGDRKLRSIGSLYLESVHVVVAAGSDIQGIADLAGKRVSVDELGSGTQLDVSRILATYGMTFSDILPVYLKTDDAIDRLQRGSLDAFFLISGYPVKGIKQLVDEGVGRLVGLELDQIERLIESYDFFADHAIAAGVYSNESEIPTISVPAQFIVRTNVSEEIVYQITKNLWSSDTLDVLASGHPRGEDINPATALQGIGVPLHPGAIRYYDELGFKIDGVLK